MYLLPKACGKDLNQRRFGTSHLWCRIQRYIILIRRSNTVNRAYKTVYCVSSYIISCSNLQPSKLLQPPSHNPERCCPSRGVPASPAPQHWQSGVMPSEHSAGPSPFTGHLKLPWGEAGGTPGPGCPHREQVTTSGARTSGAPRLCSRSVHLSGLLQTQPPVLFCGLGEMWFTTTLCHLCPVVVLSARAEIHWSPQDGERWQECPEL